MKRALKTGDKVYFDGPFSVGASSPYTVVRVMPLEKDDLPRYRIKNAGESFERVAHEDQLRRVS
jgi:hypothetical protein